VENRTDEKTRRLVHVKYAAAAVDECVRNLHEAVDRARAAGATWSQISELLNTSEQEAEDEFSSSEHAENR
jgi:hypothetical protein